MSAGSAAIHYAIINIANAGDNIVGTAVWWRHTLFAHVSGAGYRCALPQTIRQRRWTLIDDNTKAVFFETIGNPAGNIVDITAVTEMAHRPGLHYRRQRSGLAFLLSLSSTAWILLCIR